MKQKIKFINYGQVKNPQFSTDGSVGLDIFLPSEFVIEPGKNKIIPTGLYFNIPKGYYFEVKNRSSIAAKKNLVVGACIVDSDYQGEVFIDLHNIGTNVESLKSGEKFAQLILHKQNEFELEEEIEFKNLFTEITERGSGGFGSTNNK